MSVFIWDHLKQLNVVQIILMKLVLIVMEFCVLISDYFKELK